MEPPPPPSPVRDVIYGYTPYKTPSLCHSVRWVRSGLEKTNPVQRMCYFRTVYYNIWTQLSRNISLRNKILQYIRFLSDVCEVVTLWISTLHTLNLNTFIHTADFNGTYQSVLCISGPGHKPSRALVILSSVPAWMCWMSSPFVVGNNITLSQQL